jgi:hypothetical protein
MMALIKTIYRLTMRQFIFICFLFAIFGIACYVVFFHGEDENQVLYFSEYDNVITFWSNDFHIR